MHPNASTILSTMVMFSFTKVDTIRYDTIGEFNVDWKAEYTA